MARTSTRRAFTLMEMMVVVTVIIALAGIGVPTYRAVMQQMKTSATRTLVKQVAMAIDAYRPQRWVWTDDVSMPMKYVKWTFGLKTTATFKDSHGMEITLPNGAVTIDGMLEPPGGVASSDGRVFEKTSSFPAGQNLINSGYTGFYDMAGGGIDARYVNDSKVNPNLPHHQIIDAWGEPLRVMFGKNIAGGGCAVWSPGRNHVDDIDSTLQPVTNAQGYACDDLRSWVEADDEDKSKK